jgi:acetyl-CoA carboxylase biotin carboxylase subunit
VNELVTGLDLVKWQFRIAAGEKLDLPEKDLRPRGAAIECRIYAEDPDRGFTPSPGRIRSLHPPTGPGVREDSGMYEGYDVPIHYDPLLSKLICWGEDRAEAIARMRRALGEYRILGIPTTVPFHRLVMDDEAFCDGRFDTGFVADLLGRQGADGHGDHATRLEEIAIAAAAIRDFEGRADGNGWKQPGNRNAWKYVYRRRQHERRF